jgi:hypothetical protein
LQWLQNLSQTNGDSLSNVSRETIRTLREKEEISERKKLMSLKQTVRTKVSRDLYRRKNGFMKGYQPRSNLV